MNAMINTVIFIRNEDIGKLAYREFDKDIKTNKIKKEIPFFELSFVYCPIMPQFNESEHTGTTK